VAKTEKELEAERLAELLKERDRLFGEAQQAEQAERDRAS